MTTRIPNYIGIDLGTTNSAIASFNGKKTRIWKSPEQNDVTPSAIVIGEHGQKFFGHRAYNNLYRYPNDSATLFKRMLGTKQVIHFASTDINVTPEECSAEILRVLMGYLPNEINAKDVCVVITVPAAFSQIKKLATLKAAELAGIPNVALMQEPVAAVMTAITETDLDGYFVVYDLGGGTFDITVAECVGKRVSILVDGGLEICGGRDIDRAVYKQIVFPWLNSNFNLPDDFATNPKHTALSKSIYSSIERAKIEVSTIGRSQIMLDGRFVDNDGKNIYLGFELTKSMIDSAIEDIVYRTVLETKGTIEKAGLTTDNISEIIFIGGPTNYKPLRDKVSSVLGIKSNIEINPMTAVAEGAAIFAESIDWNDTKHSRKNSVTERKTGQNIHFKYVSRTTNDKAKIVFSSRNTDERFRISLTCGETGWTSGELDMIESLGLSVPLVTVGKNTFVVNVRDSMNNSITLENDTIEITHTVGEINAIPASHSIGIEVRDEATGCGRLDYLVNAGDSLPTKGKRSFVAVDPLSSGSTDSINFKVWEGDISEPISDNRFIGLLKIKGTDFTTGIIPVGAEIICNYEISDSGAISLEIEIPNIGGTFRENNMYSYQEGEIGIDSLYYIVENANDLLARVEDTGEIINDERLNRIRSKMEEIVDSSPEKVGIEDVQIANEGVLSARKLLAQVRRDHAKELRQQRLNDITEQFNDILPYAAEAQRSSFETMKRNAQFTIMLDDNTFENIIEEIDAMIFSILWNNDEFVTSVFATLTSSDSEYMDKKRFEDLKVEGLSCICRKDTLSLKRAVRRLLDLRIVPAMVDDMLVNANIMRRFV